MDEKIAAEAPTQTPSGPFVITERLIGIVSAAVGIIYFFSNPRERSAFDYTFRVAENLLHGNLSFIEKPPSWLNEFVFANGAYHTVFSLGAVLSMVPFALLKTIGFIKENPTALIAGLLAAGTTYFLLKIASKYDLSPFRQIFFTIAIVFGTFMWTNITFGGAWHLALGFAMVGELGAIYFTIFDRRPVLAGIFFALAFGNRTENLLTAPVFLYLLSRSPYTAPEPEKIEETEVEEQAEGDKSAEITAEKPVAGIWSYIPGFNLKNIIAFCSVPFVLGVLTLAYNYIRFQSMTDFGHSRIPGVLQEPWYKDGIFSIYYIPRQGWEMIMKGWDWRDTMPYLRPNPFGSSVLLSSPFLLFCFRDGSRDRVLKYASWIAIIMLTILLWIHGNSGGWQYSYRYAMVLLPWIFVLILESAPKKATASEWLAWVLSFAASAYATWLYHWTDLMKP